MLLGVDNKVIHLVQKAPPTPNAGIIDIMLPWCSQSNHTDGAASTSATSTSNSGAGVTTATSSQFIVGTIPLRNPAHINPASITQVTNMTDSAQVIIYN